MSLWQSLMIADRPARRDLAKALTDAAALDHHVACYYTPRRGWYGWHLDTESEPHTPERYYPILAQGGQLVSVRGSAILKAAAAIGVGAPDEIT